MLNIKFSLRFGLTLMYVIIFCIVLYGLKSINVIDDVAFVFNVLLAGLYQWFYLLPIILYLKKKNKENKGYFVGGMCITFLNIALWIWIILDPSTFF